jgi:hypothetical protein
VWPKAPIVDRGLSTLWALAGEMTTIVRQLTLHGLTDKLTNTILFDHPFKRSLSLTRFNGQICSWVSTLLIVL